MVGWFSVTGVAGESAPGGHSKGKDEDIAHLDKRMVSQFGGI